MRFRGILISSIVLSLGSCLAIPVNGSVCALDPLRVGPLRGQVLSVGKFKEPLANAVVVVRKAGLGTPTLVSVTTGVDGRFAIASIPPGRYSLHISHPNFISMGFDVIHVKRQAVRGCLEIGLGVDLDAPCGGGYAAVRVVQEE